MPAWSFDKAAAAATSVVRVFPTSLLSTRRAISAKTATGKSTVPTFLFL